MIRNQTFKNMFKKFSYLSMLDFVGKFPIF